MVAGSDLRVCGPNCEGFFNLPAGVPAGFSPTIDYERGLKDQTYLSLTSAP